MKYKVEIPAITLTVRMCEEAAAPQAPATWEMTLEPPAKPKRKSKKTPAPAPAETAEPVTPAAAAENLAELMVQITPLVANKKITIEKIQEIVASFGVGSLPALGIRPDLIPEISAKIAEVCSE